jgi:hypothetical protein
VIGPIVVVLLAAVGYAVKLILDREYDEWAPRVADAFVRAAAGVLPADERAGWRDEWTAELCAIRAETERASGVVWSAGLVLAAPKIALTIGLTKFAGLSVKSALVGSRPTSRYEFGFVALMLMPAPLSLITMAVAFPTAIILSMLRRARGVEPAPPLELTLGAAATLAVAVGAGTQPTLALVVGASVGVGAIAVGRAAVALRFLFGAWTYAVLLGVVMPMARIHESHDVVAAVGTIGSAIGHAAAYSGSWPLAYYLARRWTQRPWLLASAAGLALFLGTAAVWLARSRQLSTSGLVITGGAVAAITLLARFGGPLVLMADVPPWSSAQRAERVSQTT